MDWIVAIVGQALFAAAVYGGIRADLRNVKESTRRAHERIDHLYERNHA